MKWKKYTKIKALGTEETDEIFDGLCVVQEKIDGGNFSFFVEDNELIVASRNMVMTGKIDYKGWKAIPVVTEAFEKCLKLFNPSYLYIGESLQKHTISYDSIPGFVGYDIWNEDTESFLNWKDSKKEFESLGLEFIHVHFERNGSEITTEELEKCIKHSLYKEGDAEGIVIKNYSKLNKYSNPLFAKIVTDDFKEKNRAVFKGTNQPPKEDNSTILIASTYSTEARIEKTIHKLVDEGHKLDMSMIPVLFNTVAEDIFEENAVEIYHTFDKIDFKHLRGIVAKKCIPVLKKVLLERAI